MTRENNLHEIAPRVRHLEVEVGAVKSDIAAVKGQLRDDMSLVFSKLDGLSVAIAGHKPLNITEGLKTGLSILQTAVLLIGAAVASIVYVSSNANNADLALIKERQTVQGLRLDRLERPEWSTQVAPAPTRLSR